MNVPLYLYLARRWTLYVVVPAVLVGLLAYGVVSRQARTYEASATLYVQEASSASNVPGTTDVAASQALIPTYSQILTLPVIAQTVDRTLAGRYPGYRLESHNLRVSGQAASGTAASQVGTQLLQLSVTDTSPQRAAAAANTVAGSFINIIVGLQQARFRGGANAIQQQIGAAQSNIQDITQRIAEYKGPPTGLNDLKAQLSGYQSILQTLYASLQAFNVGKDTALNGVKVLSPAMVPTVPIGPHPLWIALIAGFLVLVLAAGALYLYEHVDDSLKTPEDVEGVLGAPILGTVEHFNVKKVGTQLVAAQHGRSLLSEVYRMVRTNIYFSHAENPPRSIVVTSSHPSEGKSTTASNLALVTAEGGRNTVLVDADFRRPTLHKILQARRQPGLTGLLLTTEELNVQGSQATPYVNLTLIAAGPVPPRPTDLLSSERMHAVVKHLEQKSDLVVIDSPPLLAVADAAVLAALTDGVVLVVDPSKVRKRDLVRSRDVIESVGGRVLGVVINRLSRRSSAYYYHSYRHQDGYQYRYDLSGSAVPGEA